MSRARRLIESLSRSQVEVRGEPKPIIYRDRVLKDAIEVCPHCMEEMHEKGTFLHEDGSWVHGACGGRILPRPMSAEQKAWLHGLFHSGRVHEAREPLSPVQVGILKSKEGRQFLDALFCKFDEKTGQIVDRAREEYIDHDGQVRRRERPLD